MIANVVEFQIILSQYFYPRIETKHVLRPNSRFEKFEVRYPKPAGLKNDVNSMRSGECINKYCYGCGLSGGCIFQSPKCNFVYSYYLKLDLKLSLWKTEQDSLGILLRMSWKILRNPKLNSSRYFRILLAQVTMREKDLGFFFFF